jgi:hypothetical protein
VQHVALGEPQHVEARRKLHDGSPHADGTPRARPASERVRTPRPSTEGVNVLTILLVIIVLLLLFGGGWGYSRRRRI